jgi:rhodanese-related sulfurtransferase
MLKEAKEVCPTTTRRLISQGALLLDVREPHELATCAFDVPAIVNIPLSEMEKRWSEIPKDREVVVVCQVGERSLKATYFLQYHGHTSVSNMGGGLAKWVRKGFPVKGQLAADASAATSSCCCAKAGSASVCTEG